MRQLFFLGSLLFLLASCGKEAISGNGTTTTEDRSISNFTEVSTSGATNVHIQKGANLQVTVKGYSNLLPYLETNVVNNRLEIRFRPGSNIQNNNTEVFITMPQLFAIKNSGSATVTTKGAFVSDAFEANVSGSGTILMENGDAGVLAAFLSGSGKIRTFGVDTERAEVSLSGSGLVEVTSYVSLKANVSGSGEVHYKGNPAIESSITGSGKVIRKN